MKERSIGIIGKSKTGKTRNILFNQMKEEIKNNNRTFRISNKGKRRVYSNTRNEKTYMLVHKKFKKF